MMMQRKDAASELASELERMRVTDPVTRMANRKAFSDAVDRCIATDVHDAVAAVLYLEPDGLDSLQADLSAGAMDEFVADLASVIRRNLEETDTPARISEGGFAILVHRPSVADMETLAGNILKACRSHMVEIDDRAFSITCSIGVSNIGRRSPVRRHLRTTPVAPRTTGRGGDRSRRPRHRWSLGLEV